MKRVSLKNAMRKHQQDKARKQRQSRPARVTLAALSLPELAARREAIVNDPANSSGGGLYLYRPEARRKLDDLAWAVRNRMSAEGE